jgi:hypothetical protein
VSRPIDRIAPMLAEVERVWRAHPDWRLGQVIGNAAREPGHGAYRDPFNVEDDAMWQGLMAIESPPDAA